MADASDKVEYTEWRIVRIPLSPSAPRWPFMELEVGESFVEDDLEKWATLRTKATLYKKRYGRSWGVKKKGGVIIVRRLE